MKKLIVALSILGILTGMVAADSYVLVNKTGDTLKIQTKAIAKPPTQPPGKQDTFEVEPGVQTKRVDFGQLYRLMMFNIYPKSNMNHTWCFKCTPEQLNGADKNYRITMNADFSVKVETL